MRKVWHLNPRQAPRNRTGGSGGLWEGSAILLVTRSVLAHIYVITYIYIYIYTVYTCIYTVYDECYCIGNINYGRYCVFIIMLFMMKITAMIIINMFTN